MGGILDTFGVVPLLLLAAGLFWTSKYSKALMVIGVVYGLARVLFAVREVKASVDVSGDPVISYPGRTPPVGDL